LTGGSTIMASVILFVLGGTGIQPFAFTFLIGLIVGTYSSVTIAAPLVIGGPKSTEPAPVSQPPKRLAHPAPVSA
jgi:preprotein translocase subunit SecF